LEDTEKHYSVLNEAKISLSNELYASIKKVTTQFYSTSVNLASSGTPLPMNSHQIDQLVVTAVAVKRI